MTETGNYGSQSVGEKHGGGRNSGLRTGRVQPDNPEVMSESVQLIFLLLQTSLRAIDSKV